MEKLIRFDWAIKNLLRNKANFDILEGFLSAMLQQKMTVLRLLESESNQEDAHDKFNRVDLLVEDSRRQLILIEVQVEPEHDYFHRMAYGAAKLMTEYLDKGQAYGDIKKIISVNVAYFSLGVGNDYVYYGSTNFIGIHTGDVLKLTEKQAQRFDTQDVKKIFPEYYLIRVEKFSDEVHEALDEWIYMLKHSEIRPEFTAEHIQEASERLRVMNLPAPERKAYNAYMEEMSYQASMHLSRQMDAEEAEKKVFEKGMQKGMQRGEKKGRLEEKVTIVKKSLDQGLDIPLIAQITDLTSEEILRIQEELRLENP